MVKLAYGFVYYLLGDKNSPKFNQIPGDLLEFKIKIFKFIFPKFKFKRLGKGEGIGVLFVN